jgi:hypothetical protein
LGQALSQLELEFQIRNLVLEPVVAPMQGEKLYWCLLTRIDEAAVIHQGRSFRIGADRSVTQEQDGDYQAIQNFVAANLHITSPVDEEPPEPGEQGGPVSSVGDLPDVPPPQEPGEAQPPLDEAPNG